MRRKVAGAEARPLSMRLSSLGLIAAKVASLGLGFLFWLLAARRFAPATVGLAAAVVSAMMLCVQLPLVRASFLFGLLAAGACGWGVHVRLATLSLPDRSVTLEPVPA